MGCDGGSIPRRDELVRVKRKPEQKDKDAERSFKWRNCALSQQPLQAPVVVCALGRLYSKSSVLEALLDKDTKPDSISHIKNMKDIKDLKLVKNPAYVDTEHTDGAVGEGSAPYICPISGIEMTGKFRFVLLWSCGCVLAERALREVKQNLCHMCQQPFTDNDIVVLNENGTEDNKLKMATRLAKRKSKAAKPINAYQQSTSTGEKKEPETGTSRAIKKEIESIPLPRGRFGSNKRAFSSNDLIQDPSYKKTKKDYSIAKDPQSSEVYKSLFTSHASDQNQQRAHWVTYNPFYN